MSLAPSPAACMMIELTSRTSGASETRPRLEIVLVVLDDADLVERRLRLAELGVASELLDLVEDVVPYGDDQVEAIACRQPQLVDRVDVPRIGDCDTEPVSDQGDRNGVSPLERRHRNGACGVHRNAEPPSSMNSSHTAGESRGDAVRLCNPSSARASPASLCRPGRVQPQADPRGRAR